MNYFRLMPILNDIVQQINEGLTSTLFSQSKRFSGSKLYGICEQAVKTGRQKEEFPSIVDLAGDGKYVGIDDKQNLIIYHRKQNLSISDDTVNKGYGDNPAGSINTYSMVMVVYMNRKKLNMEADELVVYLQKHFPYTLENKNFTYLSASIDSVILNTQQVFRTEYTNVNYFMKPEHALIAISYTIEGKPNLACFNRCPE